MASLLVLMVGNPVINVNVTDRHQRPRGRAQPVRHRALTDLGVSVPGPSTLYPAMFILVIAGVLSLLSATGDPAAWSDSSSVAGRGDLGRRRGQPHLGHRLHRVHDRHPHRLARHRHRLPAHPDRDRVRDRALSPLRDRPDHQPDARLGERDRRPGGVVRGADPRPPERPRAGHPGRVDRGRGVHAPDRRAPAARPRPDPARRGSALRPHGHRPRPPARRLRAWPRERARPGDAPTHGRRHEPAGGPAGRRDACGSGLEPVHDDDGRSTGDGRARRPGRGDPRGRPVARLAGRPSRHVGSRVRPGRWLPHRPPSAEQHRLAPRAHRRQLHRRDRS